MILTTSDPVLSWDCRWRISKIVFLLSAFPAQNWVKSGQNRVKTKNSENWEKIQFFHVSTTSVALELDFLCLVEKKSIFENTINDDFFEFSWKKDPNWSPRSHCARKSAKCQNTPFGMNIWGKTPTFQFLSLLTPFWVWNAKEEIKKSWKIWKYRKKSRIRPVRFPVKTRSKVVKIK